MIREMAIVYHVYMDISFKIINAFNLLMKILIVYIIRILFVVFVEMDIMLMFMSA